MLAGTPADAAVNHHVHPHLAVYATSNSLILHQQVCIHGAVDLRMDATWLTTCHSSSQTLGLDHFELLLEKALDTRVLLAWGPNAVVLSFRGTSSWTNLKADLSAWLTGGRGPPEPVS